MLQTSSSHCHRVTYAAVTGTPANQLGCGWKAEEPSSPLGSAAREMLPAIPGLGAFLPGVCASRRQLASCSLTISANALPWKRCLHNACAPRPLRSSLHLSHS